MGKCRFAIANFSEYDYTVLKSMISVVEVRTEADWEEVSEAKADVVFVGMDEPDGEPIWQRVTETIRVWCTRSGDAEAEFILKLPVRPDPLSQLLRELETEAAADGASGEPATKAAVKRGRGAASGDAFRPQDSILGYIEKIRDGGVQGLLHARHDDPTFPPPELLVDGASERFLWGGSEAELAALCAMPAEMIRGRQANQDEYQRGAVGLEERPLTQLLWLAAIYGSAGVPLEGLTPSVSVRMDTRATNTGIPLAPEEKKLERLLMDNPHSAEQLVAESGLQEKQVIAFINGCLALGIAHLEQ